MDFFFVLPLNIFSIQMYKYNENRVNEKVEKNVREKAEKNVREKALLKAQENANNALYEAVTQIHKDANRTIKDGVKEIYKVTAEAINLNSNDQVDDYTRSLSNIGKKILRASVL
jgi:vacuolar-type H+-ATPase subunit H